MGMPDEYPNKMQQMVQEVHEHKSTLQPVWDWLIAHVPGGEWTILGCTLLGFVVLLGGIFRKQAQKIFVPVLNFLLLLFTFGQPKGKE